MTTGCCLEDGRGGILAGYLPFRSRRSEWPSKLSIGHCWVGSQGSAASFRGGQWMIDPAGEPSGLQSASSYVREVRMEERERAIHESGC